MKTKNKNIVVWLCFEAIMTALFVVLDLLAIPIGPNIKITVSGLPIILAAVLYGPWSGAAVGLIGAFIGQLKYPLSLMTPLWILPAAVRGLVMGLLFLAFRKKTTYPWLLLEVAISSLVVTALNTVVLYIDSIYWGYYSYATVFGVTLWRVLGSVLTAIALSIVVTPVVNAVKKQVRK